MNTKLQIQLESVKADGRAPMSPRDREIAFARDQISILLRYVTLYVNGTPVFPDAFAIRSDPETILPLPGGSEQ